MMQSKPTNLAAALKPTEIMNTHDWIDVLQTQH
jgi:hypothetical protein